MVGRQHYPVAGSDIGRNLGKRGRTACFTLQTLTVGKDLFKRLLRRAGLTALFPDCAGFGSLGIGRSQVSPYDALHPVKAQLQDKNAANKDEHQNGSQSDHSFGPFIKISWLSPVTHVKCKMVVFKINVTKLGPLIQENVRRKFSTGKRAMETIELD